MTVVPPLGRCGRHLKITSERNSTTTYYLIHINRVTLRIEGSNRQTEAQSTLQVSAAVCLWYEYSIARFSLLLILTIGLVPCYTLSTVSALRSSTLYAPPPKRMRHTIRNKQIRLAIHPPRPTTPLMLFRW